VKREKIRKIKMSRKFFPVYEPYITRDEEKYILKAVRSGWISSLGEFITQFEREFAEFVGVKSALTTSNSTSALHSSIENQVSITNLSSLQ